MKFNRNIEAGDSEVCAISKSRKSAHPPSDRPRSKTRLALVQVDLWGKHPVESYGGCQSLAMFTDDMSRMRWVVIIKTKNEAADALSQVLQDVAEPKVSVVARSGTTGEANVGEGCKHWRGHLESRRRLTHRIFLKEVLSQRVVLAP